MRKIYLKNKKKPDMLHEQYHIKIIFIVHLENTKLYIFFRRYVNMKSEKFHWHQANSRIYKCL